MSTLQSEYSQPIYVLKRRKESNSAPLSINGRSNSIEIQNDVLESSSYGTKLCQRHSDTKSATTKKGEYPPHPPHCRRKGTASTPSPAPPLPPPSCGFELHRKANQPACSKQISNVTVKVWISHSRSSFGRPNVSTLI